MDGWLDGCEDGSAEMLGDSLGCDEGWLDGCELGFAETEGCIEGWVDGWLEGCEEGKEVDGASLGCPLG